METLTIELPAPLRRYIEQRASAAGYGSAGDFIRDVLERERARSARFEALVREGSESGEAIEVDDAWWDRKFAEFDRRFGDGRPS